MKKATISIPVLTPSNNELLRMHEFQRPRLKINYMKEIQVAVSEMGMEIKPLRCPVRRRVEIISFRKRKCDHDNFVGGLKPLIDAIKDLRMIWDDSPEWMELEPSQESCPDPFTEITIQGIQE